MGMQPVQRKTQSAVLSLQHRRLLLSRQESSGTNHVVYDIVHDIAYDIVYDIVYDIMHYSEYDVRVAQGLCRGTLPGAYWPLPGAYHTTYRMRHRIRYRIRYRIRCFVLPTFFYCCCGRTLCAWLHSDHICLFLLFEWSLWKILIR